MKNMLVPGELLVLTAYLTLLIEKGDMITPEMREISDKIAGILEDKLERIKYREEYQRANRAHGD